MDKDLSEILRAENHEDFVEYFIFPTDITCFGCSKQNHNHHCHPKIETISNGEGEKLQQNGCCKKDDEDSKKLQDSIEDEAMTKFNDLYLTINASVLDLMGEYLWQKEPFMLRKITSPTIATETGKNISTVTKEEQNIIPYFHGLTRYGENVEDEWFIVYILLKLTEQFPDIIIRVADNDGEFLLIETASHLPDWAESDSICLQRVYIYQGKMHIIPLPQVVPNAPSGLLSILPKSPPTIQAAIKIITKYPEITLANELIQKTILQRIGNYPEKLENSFQHTNMMLPPKLVKILKQRPDFVSQAVQAFYYRDPIDLKTARYMKNFKPGDSLVKSRVRLTKVMYAMLSKQDYRPDPKVGWGFPRPTSSEFKGHSLGAKLTTGFEILLSRANPNCSIISPKQKSKSQSEDHDQEEDILKIRPTSKAWLQYNEKLKGIGYYKDYLEFSKPYMELEEKAKIFFTKSCEATKFSVNDADNTMENCRRDIGGDMSCCSSELMMIEDWTIHELKQLLNNIKDVDFETLKKESHSLPPDDDDSWLDVNPDDFESLLESQFQTNMNADVEDIPGKLKQFLSLKSNVEGVEVSSKCKNTTGLEKVNGYLDPIQEGQPPAEAIDFRADDFVEAMDKLIQDLHKKDTEKSSSDDSSFSDEEEYLNFEEIKNKYPFSKKSKIHQLMRRMDEELARSEVGRSFSDDSPSTSASALARQGRAAAAIASTSSSNTATPIDEEPSEPDEFDEIEAFEPVQVDLYTLKNMLESFRSQDSPFGPSSNILRNVGYDISKAKQ